MPIRIEHQPSPYAVGLAGWQAGRGAAKQRQQKYVLDLWQQDRQNRYMEDRQDQRQQRMEDRQDQRQQRMEDMANQRGVQQGWLAIGSGLPKAPPNATPQQIKDLEADRQFITGIGGGAYGPLTPELQDQLTRRLDHFNAIIGSIPQMDIAEQTRRGMIWYNPNNPSEFSGKEVKGWTAAQAQGFDPSVIAAQQAQENERKAKQEAVDKDKLAKEQRAAEQKEYDAAVAAANKWDDWYAAEGDKLYSDPLSPITEDSSKDEIDKLIRKRLGDKGRPTERPPIPPLRPGEKPHMGSPALGPALEPLTPADEAAVGIAPSTSAPPARPIRIDPTTGKPAIVPAAPAVGAQGGGSVRDVDEKIDLITSSGGQQPTLAGRGSYTREDFNIIPPTGPGGRYTGADIVKAIPDEVRQQPGVPGAAAIPRDPLHDRGGPRPLETPESIVGYMENGDPIFEDANGNLTLSAEAINRNNEARARKWSGAPGGESVRDPLHDRGVPIPAATPENIVGYMENGDAILRDQNGNLTLSAEALNRNNEARMRKDPSYRGAQSATPQAAAALRDPIARAIPIPLAPAGAQGGGSVRDVDQQIDLITSLGTRLGEPVSAPFQAGRDFQPGTMQDVPTLRDQLGQPVGSPQGTFAPGTVQDASVPSGQAAGRQGYDALPPAFRQRVRRAYEAGSPTTRAAIEERFPGIQPLPEEQQQMIVPPSSLRQHTEAQYGPRRGTGEGVPSDAERVIGKVEGSRSLRSRRYVAGLAEAERERRLTTPGANVTKYNLPPDEAAAERERAMNERYERAMAKKEERERLAASGQTVGEPPLYMGAGAGTGTPERRSVSSSSVDKQYRDLLGAPRRAEEQRRKDAARAAGIGRGMDRAKRLGKSSPAVAAAIQAALRGDVSAQRALEERGIQWRT